MGEPAQGREILAKIHEKPGRLGTQAILPEMANIPRALTIAGSDSGGCAGIQADLKTFAALGVHGMSAITSVTAQDTMRVYLASDLPVEAVERQIQAVLEDIGADAVKTGMLSSSAIIRSVARQLRRFAMECLVVDPVMVSTGGDRLIQPEAVESLKQELFPLASIVTPNLREAELLTGQAIKSLSEIRQAARQILSWGARSVVIKGGHFDDPNQSTDYFFEAGQQCVPLSAERIDTANTHGSGCTFASAIAAYLARGLELRESLVQAKAYVTEAIRHSLSIGQGNGPLGHFYAAEAWRGARSPEPKVQSTRSRIALKPEAGRRKPEA